MHKFLLLSFLLVGLFLIPDVSAKNTSECGPVQERSSQFTSVKDKEDCPENTVCTTSDRGSGYRCFGPSTDALRRAASSTAACRKFISCKTTNDTLNTSDNTCTNPTTNESYKASVVVDANPCSTGLKPTTNDPNTCKCVDPILADANQDAPKQCVGAECAKGAGISCNTSSGTSEEGGKGIMTAIGCIPSQPQQLVEGLLRYGTLAAGGVAFLIMIIAALQMITAEGNPNVIKTSQEKFYSAIIGLLLIVFSVLLMQVIGFDLLGLQGFGR